MVKVKFGFSWGFGDHNNEEEIIEYEDDVTNKQIEEYYKFWLWDRVIGDRTYWYRLEENKEE